MLAGSQLALHSALLRDEGLGEGFRDSVHPLVLLISLEVVHRTILGQLHHDVTPSGHLGQAVDLDQNGERELTICFALVWQNFNEDVDLVLAIELDCLY